MRCVLWKLCAMELFLQENGISLTEKLKHLSMKRSSDILDEIGCHNSSDATVVAKESLEKEDSCVQCSLNRALCRSSSAVMPRLHKLLFCNIEALF